MEYQEKILLRFPDLYFVSMDLQLHNQYCHLLKGAYNEVGGLQKSIIIDKSLIDVYVPFLPLEQKHVRQCVERELISRGYEPDQVGHDFYDQARTSLDMDGTLTIITCCIISIPRSTPCF